MSAVPAVKFYLTPSVLRNPVVPRFSTPTPTQANMVCPACGSAVMEIRQKKVCEKCHTICETCCEGGQV